MLLPVVLAGGAGSRLWPVSRTSLPKQFAHLPGQANTLFQETVLRLDGITEAQDPLVICHEEHRFLAAEQLRQLDKSASSILLEPIARDTAPALALAALHGTCGNDDPILLVLPADHVIANSAALLSTIEAGLNLAEQGHLVTFGVSPASPETGYGYIALGEPLLLQDAWIVKEFKEKPNRELAEQFIASGCHLWNSGMFMFRASVYLNQLNLFAPDIYLNCKKAYAAANLTADFISIPLAPLADCRAQSIDFAVMEKTEKAAVISLDAGWNDVGSWDAMWQLQSKDDEGNSIEGDVFAVEVKRSLIHSESRLVAAVGLNDVIIVETADAVLVASAEKAQLVKEAVSQIELAKRVETYSHAKVACAWGYYELISERQGYRITCLNVAPGALMPPTFQCHSAGQLFMVKGSAEVSLNDKLLTLAAGDSICIAIAAKYAIANRGDSTIELIKVQLGYNIREHETL